MTYKLGTVVPQKRGTTSSRITDTVAVQTPEGDIYSDVLILYPDEQTTFIPAIGSQVVISFFDRAETKAFIVGYTHQSKIGIQKVPQSSISREVESESFAFAADDKRLKLELLAPSFVSAISDFSASLKSLKSNVSALQISSEITQEKTNHLISEINYAEASIETLLMELTDLIIKCKNKSEKIEKWLIKADTLEAEITQINSESDTTTFSANNSFTVKCNKINLCSEAPADSPVLFTKLQSILTELLTALQAMTVTCTAPSTPSSPPLNAAQFAAISAKLSTLKSTKVFLE